jgi:hypothetical protein
MPGLNPKIDVLNLLEAKLLKSGMVRLTYST